MKNIYSKLTKLLSVISVVVFSATALFAVVFAAALLIWVAYSIDYQWSVPIWAEWVILVFQRGGYIETVFYLSYQVVSFSLSSIIVYYIYSYLKSESDRKTPFTYDGAKELRGLGIKMVFLTVLSSAAMFAAGRTITESFIIKLVGGGGNLVIGILFIAASFILKSAAKYTLFSTTEL